MGAALDQPNRYYDPRFGMEAVKLLPGECYVTAEPLMLVTVLGSCVSVCLRDRSSGLGGMNHFMLPGDTGVQGLLSNSGRYGVHAMDLLINGLMRRGGQRRHFEAKVFGGGSVLKNLSADVGQRNVEFVLDYLDNEASRWPPRTCSTCTRARSTSFPAAAGCWCASCAPWPTIRCCNASGSTASNCPAGSAAGALICSERRDAR